MGNYLIERDLNSFVTSDTLIGITDNNNEIWKNEIPTALEIVASYLRFRYDVDKEFKPINVHDESDVYLKDERVENNGVLYYALQDVPVNTPLTDGTYWKQGDTRNAAIKQIVVVLVLYNIYTRINGSEIPQWLQVLYDGMDSQSRGGKMGFLKEIRKGTVQIDLPLLPEVEDGTTQSGNGIAYGYAKTVVNRNTSI